MPGFSLAGVTLVKTLESCRLAAYRDQGGVWTIGYGDTGPDIRAGVVWTQDQAEAALDARLTDFVRGVACAFHNTVPLGDNQFSACVCLAYNIGVAAFAGSSVRHLIDRNELEEVPLHFALWDKVAGPGGLVVSAGLVGRRAAEAALWTLPDDAPVPDFVAIKDAAVAAWRAAHG